VPLPQAERAGSTPDALNELDGGHQCLDQRSQQAASAAGRALAMRFTYGQGKESAGTSQMYAALVVQVLPTQP
jgi:hypothetical protein